MKLPFWRSKLPVSLDGDPGGPVVTSEFTEAGEGIRQVRVPRWDLVEGELQSMLDKQISNPPRVLVHHLWFWS